MKVLGLIAIALLSTSALAASRKSADKFQTLQSKAISLSPIDLDDSSYDELTTPPRDYSVAVLLTALEARYGCQLCRDFHPEWSVLGSSWAKGDKKGESRMLFATLDFAKGKQTFQKLMLQTAPVLLFFPPTVGPNAKTDGQPLRYEFTGPVSADQVHAWITRHIPEGGPRPPLVRPINYVRIVAVTTSLLGLVTLFSVASPYILPVIQNRNLWAAISLIAILLFTSGHMFNHIRKVAYVSGDGKGGINYFAGGFSNQFGMETQIVAAMYGVLAFAAIALALKVPRMEDAKTQQIAVFCWGAVLLGMYSFLLSVFRVKNGGYPFYLPPF